MHWVSDAIIMLIPIFGSLAFFAFLSVAVWAYARKSERQAYYEYEFRRQMVDAGKLDADDVKDLLQFETDSALAANRQAQLTTGVILVSVGVGMLFGLRFIDDLPIWMVGFIPMAIGVGMLGFSFVSSSPVPQRPLVARRTPPVSD